MRRHCEARRVRKPSALCPKSCVNVWCGSKHPVVCRSMGITLDKVRIDGYCSEWDPRDLELNDELSTGSCFELLHCW
jgi:hypothetical protein